VTVVASENGYMLSMVDDYKKGDEWINVEEVVVRAFVWSAPAMLGRGTSARGREDDLHQSCLDESTYSYKDSSGRLANDVVGRRIKRCK
jgi:hypothetical protein